MPAKQPVEVAKTAVVLGEKKARLPWDKTLVGSFLAGAYIAFGGLVAIVVSSGLDPETWGTLPTLFTGAAFTLGLILVLIAGSDLATGSMLLVPLTAMYGRLGVAGIVRNLGLVLLGNLAGALFVAYFPRAADRDHRRAGGRPRRRLQPHLRAPRRHRREQGARGDLVAGLLARRRLQLAGLPRGVDVAGR